MTPATVLDFWFDPATKPHWFVKSDAFDHGVAERLGALLEQAAAGALDHWAETPEGLLALVILLDQVPRNVHRGTPAAFATDAKALALAERAVAQGLDKAVEPARRLFLYLPFEHAENLAAQEQAVALFATTGDAEYLDYAIRHRDVIARFGRFPHRNAILGRTSTTEELEFLEQPGSSF